MKGQTAGIRSDVHTTVDTDKCSLQKFSIFTNKIQLFLRFQFNNILPVYFLNRVKNILNFKEYLTFRMLFFEFQNTKAYCCQVGNVCLIYYFNMYFLKYPISFETSLVSYQKLKVS